MEELVALVFQFLFEVGLQIFGAPALEAAAARKSRDKDQSGCGWIVLFGVFGAIAGGVSLLLAPKFLLPNAGLRITNLVVSPLIAGGLSYLAAKNLGAGRDPGEHFWRGCVFAFAFGAVRFAYAHR